MAEISKLSGVAIANVAKVDAVTKANIADINGLTIPSAIGTPTVAYSVRLLGSAVGVPSYTGACMRVRRASDSVEADVGFDSNDELSLTSPISNTSDAQTYTDFADFVDHTGTPTNAFVRKWYDQVSTNDAEQSTSSLQPAIYLSGAMRQINGKPTILCNGYGNLLYSATYSQPYSYTAVGRAGSYDRMLGNNAQWYQESGNTKILGVDVDGGNDFRNDQVNVFAVGNGASSSGKVAGADAQPAAGTFTYSVNFSFSVIGGRYSGNSNNAGEIQELIFWTSDQTNNRTDIETDINGHFSIYT